MSDAYTGDLIAKDGDPPPSLPPEREAGAFAGPAGRFFSGGDTIEQRLHSLRATSGFDYLRLGLAVAVMCLHTIALNYGKRNEIDWLWQGPFQGFARSVLCMFFALSGFLVTGSLFRAGSLTGFLTLRIMRIVPALTVEVVLSAVILGGFFTTLPLAEYYHSAGFLNYFLNIVGSIHFSLPGVFHKAPLPNMVNTNLWTLPSEAKSYGFLALAMATSVIRRRSLMLCLVIYATVAYYGAYYVEMKMPYEEQAVGGDALVMCFFWGVMLHLYRDKIRLNAPLLLACSFVGIVLLYRPYSFFAAPFLAYTTVWIGLLNPRKPAFLFSGDYSYGIYLYGFPIQQTTAYLLPSHRIWWLNLVIALPVTFCVAFLSWHGVEKHVLRHKRFAAGRNRPVARFERAAVPAFASFVKAVQRLATSPARSPFSIGAMVQPPGAVPEDGDKP